MFLLFLILDFSLSKKLHYYQTNIDLSASVNSFTGYDYLVLTY